MGSIRHVFTNNIADGTNTDIVRPSDWNSLHNYTLQDAVSLGGNTAGVMALISSGLLLLAGGSNVTLSQQGNSVTVSAASAPALPVFSNSNGVSFGTNGGTVTATVATNYQSQGAYLTTADLSQNSSKYAGTGFTTTTAAGAVIAGTNDTNGLKIAVPAYLTTAQPPGAYLTTARASNDAIGLNTAKTNVTWTANSSGLSFDAGGYAGTGFTSTTTAGTAVVGTNNTAGLSLGIPAFLTTAALSNHSHGNPQLNLTNLSGTTASNSAGFTLSLSASPPGGGAQTAISGIIASDATYTSGTVSFSNQGNITIGSSVNGATQYIRLSGNPAQTVQSAIKGFGASNTGNTAGNTGLSTGIDWVLAGSNNLTVSQSTAGGGPNTLWLSGPNLGAFLTTAALSGDTTKYAGVGESVGTVAGTDLALTVNTDGVSILYPKWLTTAMQSNAATISNVKMSAGATSGTRSDFTFADSNGISFGYSTNGVITATVATNYQAPGAYLTTAALSQDSSKYAFTGFTTTTVAGAVVAGTHDTNGLKLAVPAYLTTAMASNRGSDFVQATAAFAGTNASGTIASNGISVSVAAPGGGANLTFQDSATTLQVTKAIFSNANGVTFGFATAASIATVTGSVAAQSNQTVGMYATGNTTNNSSSTFDARTLGSINAQGGLTAGFSNGSIQLSVPATSSLVGVNGISIATAGSTISISAAEFTRSRFNPFMEAVAAAGQHGQGSLHIHPIPDPDHFQFDRVGFDINWTNATNSSGSATVSMWAGLYTRNASTLSSLASASKSVAITFAGTGGNNSLQAGGRLFTMGWTTTITKADLWMGVVYRTTSGNTDGSFSQYMVSDINSNFSGIFGAASNASNQDRLGLGYFSATTSGIPASIAFSDIRGTASQALRPPLYCFLSGTV